MLLTNQPLKNIDLAQSIPESGRFSPKIAENPSAVALHYLAWTTFPMPSHYLGRSGIGLRWKDACICGASVGRAEATDGYVDAIRDAIVQRGALAAKGLQDSLHFSTDLAV
jgi:hypothetical protein